MGAEDGRGAAEEEVKKAVSASNDAAAHSTASLAPVLPSNHLTSP